MVAMIGGAIAAAAKTAWLTRACRVPQDWSLRQPVVSLTFDDVPFSAFEHGLPVLSRRRVGATFYACTAFRSEGRPHLGAAEISALSDLGHEIGCHTASHYSVRLCGPHGLAQDCRLNQAALREMTGGRWPRNFAFPHGEMAVGIKRGLMRNYRSLRSTRNGINHGTFDLACLKAVPAYYQSFDAGSVRRWLEAASDRSGWLIFYTHGISRAGATPQTAFDLRADQLADLIDMVQDHGMRIMTIDDVLTALAPACARAPSNLEEACS